MSGNISFRSVPAGLELSVERIENTTSDFTSGTLQLSLWATESPYSGGTISGYIVAEYQLPETLGPGQYYSNISPSVAYDAPPDGTYYFTMVLAEYNGSQFAIADSLNFSNTQTIGNSSGSSNNNTNNNTTGSGDTNNNSGSPGLPNSSERGEGWFTSPLIGDYKPLANGWAYSEWLGSFYFAGTAWVYRPGFDWFYVATGSSGGSSWWIFVNNFNEWCWTANGTYPSVYSQNNGWVAFDEDRLDFWDVSAGTWLGESGSGGGNSGGGVFNVDVVFTNTGFDQQTWNEIVATLNETLRNTGNTDFYQYSFTSSELIFRYDMPDAAAASQLRSSLEPLEGDYGSYTISVD